MKINCTCGNLIVDQTDYLKNKGYVISDTQWFHFWEMIDIAIEKSGESKNDKEAACMNLRKEHVFKTIWECQNCGKIFFDGENGKLITYSADSKEYNRILNKK